MSKLEPKAGFRKPTLSALRLAAEQNTGHQKDTVDGMTWEPDRSHRLVPLQAGTFVVTVHDDLLGHEFRRVKRCQVSNECDPRTDGGVGCLCDQQAEAREMPA